MTSICDLSEDLLVEILSLVEPDDAVATSLVSKQWRSLWKLVPRAEFDFVWNASRFINNYLLLSKAPVLETLRLRLRLIDYKPEDIERWVEIAVARHVRNIELLNRNYLSEFLPCPRSLFTCKGLVVLRLQEVGFWDIPSTIFLQSLKELSLVYVKFFNVDELVRDELVHRLLSACPILETLNVRRCLSDPVKSYRVEVPTLQRLYIMLSPTSMLLRNDEREYIINAPSLKILKVSDEFSWLRSSLVKMPELVKADLNLRPEDSVKLLRCIASAKHLSLCVNSSTQLIKGTYGENLCQLEDLELCPDCSLDWLCLLLKQSPKLRVLRLNTQSTCGKGREIVAQWEQPCCVPECLVSTLETVEWNGYRGTEAEKKLAIYLLEKTNHLKMMTLSPLIVEVTDEFY